MKRIKKIVAGLVLSAVCLGCGTGSVMAHEYEHKELWEAPVEALSGQSMRALFEMIGDFSGAYTMEDLIDSEYGELLMEQLAAFIQYPDEAGEDILSYWENYKGGIKKELHAQEDEEYAWASYVPMSAYEEQNADREYPLVILLRGGNDPKYMAECFGVVHYAAECQEYITVIPTNREPEGILQLIEDVKAEYPIDTSRIYITGNSAGGAATLRNAYANPQVFAAVAPFANGVAGVGSAIVPEAQQWINLAKARLPIMYLYGDRDVLYNMPIMTNTSIAADDQIAILNQWLACNDCIYEPLTQGISRDLTLRSEDYTKKSTGIDFTTTYTKEYPDTNYYFGEFRDTEDTAMFTFVVAENGSHWHAPSYAEIIWNYFKQFSRNPETGELVTVTVE